MNTRYVLHHLLISSTRRGRHRQAATATPLTVNATQVTLTELHKVRLRTTLNIAHQKAVRIQSHGIASATLAPCRARLHLACPADEVTITNIICVGDADRIAKSESGVTGSGTRWRIDSTAQNMLAAEVGCSRAAPKRDFVAAT